ncbi:MAG: 23S rRNA (uracil(1939)-C(5))-methyltransferase RlmD [Clostridia bacterium]
MIVRNQQLSLRCSRLGSELEGICELEGQAVFVPGALPGEDIEALALKVMPRYAFAKLQSVLAPSPDRVEPRCPVYAQCGGCSGQHMRYAATLAAKRMQVLDCLNRIGGFALSDADVPPMLGADNPWRWRNKTALPVGGTASEPQLGFYRRRSHAIIPIADCPVTMGDLSGTIEVVTDWMRQAGVSPYDEETGNGLLRHVIFRTTRERSAMVLLVATSEKLPDVPYLIKRLGERVHGFCGLHLSVNRARTNAILGKSCQKLFGDDAIFETLLGLTFEISPLSFFQVHPAQTERLYQQAIDYASVRETDVVVDAYAGAGTIALCAARKAARVIGIEVVSQAVESAKRNAARNGIHNAEFFTATVEELLPKLVRDGLRPDVVILDPPRKGVEPEVIEAVLAAAPSRVVYVSCHVPTQARDLALLKAGGYRFVACQPVDMFCYAGGVENVALMARE